MKKITRKILTILLVSILPCQHIFAMNNDSIIQAEIDKAISLSTGNKGVINRSKAFDTLTKYAQAGNPKAMNGLGLMYMEGYMSIPDTIKGLNWISRAAEGGYAKAYTNLGVIYKYGRSGIKQDLEKSFYYFQKAALLKDANGLYSTGYMYYKGLGCEQNYEKAILYFEEGAAIDHAPSMYMLGLCYRNGYGVPKSNGNANFWLSEADRKAYKFATDEIESEEPENSVNRQFLRSSQAIPVPLKHAKVEHLDPGTEINGIYEGILVTYDWSGKNIVSEKPLKVNLLSDGNVIGGEWIEQGKDTVLVQAMKSADKIKFNHTRQYRTDHYSNENPVLFNFEQAEIQLISDNNGTSLIGTLRMYSPETMEPERPMYISLRKTDNSTEMGKERIIEGLRAYPVPFSGDLNLSFYQKEETDVIVGIYDYTGKCVFMYDAGKLHSGENHLVLSPELAGGTYILKLISGKNTGQVIVISNASKK